MSSMQQHIPHPTNGPQLDYGNRAAVEPMAPHYEAPTTEGCSSVFAPQSKIENCVEIDAKDDVENSSVRVATNKREKRRARRLVKRAATCKSPFIQQCAQENPRLSPKQKFVADFTLDPKGDEW